jgi:aldose 1-epimerase
MRTQPGVKDRDPTIFILDDGAGGRAEMWPALGWNCFRWQALRDGRRLDLLYADPNLFGDGRPTRSGVPILFPFPNRIRAGRFSWDGCTYELPLLDSTRKNAIHGFVCRRPWRVVGQGADGSGAWLTGEFDSRRDAGDDRELWPADYVLRVTHRLGAGGLRIEAEVVNPDVKTLPFGLGYHPYFRTPFASGVPADDCTVQVPAGAMWPVNESLPTGLPTPLDAARDLTGPRRVGALHLDDVLTRLAVGTQTDGLIERARLTCGDATLALWCSADFRELVVFNPPHRQAFCVEPYTCATDAVNLQAQGLDAGWRALPPGGRWTGIVELRV